MKNNLDSNHNQPNNNNQGIINYLESIGITAVGFCSTKPFEGYANFIVDHHQKSVGHSVYLEHSFNKDKNDMSWFDPKTVFEGGKSIIVVLLPYNLQRIGRSVKPNPLLKKDNASKISEAAIFLDYHRLMFEKLNGLRNFIMVNHNADSVCFCDFGPLNDKAILARTGLVKIGRNSLLLHPSYGSRFYIGYVITELECMTHDLDIMDREALFHPYCQECGRCAASCPNNAIIDFGHLHSSQCISYLTQSKEWTIEMALNENQEHLITDPKKRYRPYNLSGYAYGCDICQLVCPLNGKSLKEYTYEACVSADVTKEEIEALSQKEFKESYGKTSAGWIGKKRFLRNIDWNNQ